MIRIDADQIRIECNVMDFGQRGAVGPDWLAEQLVLDDVSGIGKKRLGQSGQCATTVVGRYDDHAE
jgi:hypothetical protein